MTPLGTSRAGRRAYNERAAADRMGLTVEERRLRIDVERAKATRMAERGLIPYPADVIRRNARPAAAVRDAYPAGGPFSWFVDAATVSAGQRMRERSMDHVRGGLAPGMAARNAAARLATVQTAERRDIDFVGIFPSGLPQLLAEAFATAVSNKATLTPRLRREPLPAKGQSVEVPIFTSTVAVTSQTDDNAAVTESSPSTDTLVLPVRTLSAFVDRSLQLERAANIDRAIAVAIGESYAAELERQLIEGIGASGEVLGILNSSPGTEVVLDDADPTAAEVMDAIGETVAGVATQSGTPEDDLLVLVHPRRSAWLRTNLSSTFPLFPFSTPILSVPSIPTDLGAGTQDVIIVCDPSELLLMAGPPKIVVHSDITESSTLTARVLAYAFVAFTAARRPEALGTLTGTSLVAPY